MQKNQLHKAVALALGLGVASLSAQAAQVPAGVKLADKQVLVKGNGAEPASLDPQKIEGVPESHILQDLLETLVIQDAEGNIIPGAAVSWETTDNQHFTFHLRPDAKWSNGDPVTAEDFVFAWQRAVDPKTASPYSWYLEMTHIKNAGDIIAGKKAPETLGVKAVDDHTLKVELDTPLPYFVIMTGHTTLAPVHKKTVEKYGDKWTRPGNFVSNGAYTLDKWVVNEYIELKRNPNYWDNENTVINKVVYLPIEDSVAEMNRFLAGEIDITSGMPLEHYKKLKKEHPDEVVTSPILCTYYYSFNTKKAPFDNVNVRKALSYAINREALTQYVLGQGQKPAYGITPEIIAGFNPTLPPYGKMSQQERNAEAKKLLASAGFDANHPLEFELLYNTSENHKKIALAISSMWKQAFGSNTVKVRLNNQEWKTYLTSQRQGKFDVTRAGWCGDYNEASTFLDLLRSNNGNNSSKYNSPVYDGLMDQAVKTVDPEKRNRIYEKAELQLSKDMRLPLLYLKFSLQSRLRWKLLWR